MTMMIATTNIAIVDSIGMLNIPYTSLPFLLTYLIELDTPLFLPQSFGVDVE